MGWMWVTIVDATYGWCETGSQDMPTERKPVVKRREFLAAGSAAVLAGSVSFAQNPAQPKPSAATGTTAFKLKYAPTLNMFEAHAGKDPVDNLKFMAEQGFRAFFDNGMMGKPTELVDKIVREAQRLNLTVGPFVTGVGSCVKPGANFREAAAKKMKEAVEFAKRVGAGCFLMVPGALAADLPMEKQTENVVECLKWCCKEVEKSDKCIVLEPLNPRNHPGLFLTKMAQAVDICRAVGSPACKIVDDIYHQQITEGDLIPNIDKAWDFIGAFHLGDTPGRKEPTTGEINYRNIFKHIHGKGYQGVLCMEHGKSKKGKEGELAVIEAYRWCDSF